MPFSKSHFFLISLAIALIISFSTACDPIAKLAKSGSLADKDSAAYRYLAKKKYDQACFLLEELSGVYRGTPRHRDIYLSYARAKYKMGEFIMAAYYFNDFARQYPRDTVVEEARYMEANCYFLLADPWYLDQSYTQKAFETMQLFLDTYPYSSYKEQASGQISDLRERLARKSFEQAKLYYKLGYYKAAITSLTLFTTDYPDSRMREEAQFLVWKSAYLRALNADPDKKVLRWEESFGWHEKFVDKFPGSKFAKEAESLYQAARKNLEKARKPVRKAS